MQFVIKKNGKTSQFEVVRGVDPLLDEEALRVVKGIPGKWVPGRDKGDIVKTGDKMPAFTLTSVSYTHLDVYKRQVTDSPK